MVSTTGVLSTQSSTEFLVSSTTIQEIFPLVPNRDSPSRNVPDCSQARMVPDVPKAEKGVPSSRSVPKRRSVPMFPVPNWNPIDACSRWENACSQWVKKPLTHTVFSHGDYIEHTVSPSPVPSRGRACPHARSQAPEQERARKGEGRDCCLRPATRGGVRRCVLVCRATERLEPEAREPWDAARCRALRALRRTRRARARHARPAETPQRTGRRPAGV